MERNYTIRKLSCNGVDLAVVDSGSILFHDAGYALDILLNVRYEADCSLVLIKKEMLPAQFFELRTGLAGEILQKCVNYGIKLAVWGDFSSVSSKSLRDFLYECNQGRDFFFVESEEEAARKLASVN